MEFFEFSANHVGSLPEPTRAANSKNRPQAPELYIDPLQATPSVSKALYIPYRAIRTTTATAEEDSGAPILVNSKQQPITTAIADQSNHSKTTAARIRPPP